MTGAGTVRNWRWALLLVLTDQVSFNFAGIEAMECEAIRSGHASELKIQSLFSVG